MKTQTNGHTNGHPPPLDEPTGPLCQLRIFRVESKDPTSVVTLSNSYSGCWTHFFKRSELHEPDECRWCKKIPDKVWKGYTPILRLDTCTGYYVPCVLEITENLDLDFRGVFGRGQQWMLLLEKKPDQKSWSVAGTQMGETDLKPLMPEPDIRVPLMHLYHKNEPVLLNVDNPKAARVYVRAVKAPKATDAGGKSAGENFRETPGFVEAQRQRHEQKRRLFEAPG